MEEVAAEWAFNGEQYIRTALLWLFGGVAFSIGDWIVDKIREKVGDPDRE